MKLNLLSSITRHDILNSLTGLLGYLEFSKDEQNPELLQTYIKKIVELHQREVFSEGHLKGSTFRVYVPKTEAKRFG